MNLADTLAGWSDSCSMKPGRGVNVGFLPVGAEEIPEAQTRASTQIEERAGARTNVISGTEGLN